MRDTFFTDAYRQTATLQANPASTPANRMLSHMDTYSHANYHLGFRCCKTLHTAPSR